MSDLDNIEIQAHICPKCNDDHIGSKCSPAVQREFMPSNDDRTYIAEQYRLRVEERESLKEENELLKKQIRNFESANIHTHAEGIRCERMTRIECGKIQEMQERCDSLRAENQRFRDQLIRIRDGGCCNDCLECAACLAKDVVGPRDSA